MHYKRLNDFLKRFFIKSNLDLKKKKKKNSTTPAIISLSDSNEKAMDNNLCLWNLY